MRYLATVRAVGEPAAEVARVAIGGFRRIDDLGEGDGRRDAELKPRLVFTYALYDRVTKEGNSTPALGPAWWACV
jgi:hypothetical protein